MNYTNTQLQYSVKAAVMGGWIKLVLLDGVDGERRLLEEEQL